MALISRRFRGRRVELRWLEAVPGPARDAQALRHVVGGLVVGGHGRGSGPGEVVMQHLPQGFLGDACIFECLVEAGDRALVHLLVRAVAAVDISGRGRQ